MKRLFHYSKAVHLPSICKDRAIVQATAFVTHEKPAVWCSLRQDFEPTAGAGVEEGGISRTMTVPELMQWPKGHPVRIEVSRTSCPYDWRGFKNLSGIRSKVARRLESGAKNDGANPADWRVSFDPIPSYEWLSIGYLTDDGWLDIPATAAVIESLSLLKLDEIEAFFRTMTAAMGKVAMAVE